MLVTSTKKPFFQNSNYVYTLKSVLKWFRVGVTIKCNNSVSTQLRNRHHRVSETRDVNKQFGLQHYLLTERAPKSPEGDDF